MYHMVYLKDDRQDKRFRVINPATSQYIDRLVYAPRFTEEQLPAIREWIQNVTDPLLHLQIRVAGTNKIIK